MYTQAPSSTEGFEPPTQPYEWEALSAELRATYQRTNQHNNTSEILVKLQFFVKKKNLSIDRF